MRRRNRKISQYIRSGTWAQKERNKATEVVDGVVETVDVSKHPTASIEPSDLSLADIERRKSHPVRWILFMALVLLAMIAPYWWGRDRGAGRLMDGGEPGSMDR